jgi:hypothetical protein
MERVNKLSIIAPSVTFFGLVVAVPALIAKMWKRPEN